MANSVTALTAVPAVFKIGKKDGLIYPKIVALDDTSADLEVYDPEAGAFWALYGAFWHESANHQVTFKTGAQGLVTFEFPASDGLKQPLSRAPFLIGRVGEKLNVRLAAGVISSMLLYVGRQSVLDFHS